MEIKEMFEQLNKAFEDFKKANDAELAEIKAKGSADPVLKEQVDKANAEVSRLQKSIDELTAKMNRPSAPGAMSEKDQLKAEHKAAWDKWARKGNDSGLEDIERKAINIGTPADGGYAVPEEMDREVSRLLRDLSPMREVCRIITVGGGDYKKLMNTGGTGSGWVGETTARTETNTPGFAELTPFMGEIYANPAVTQKALDDIFFNVEVELANDIITEFAEQEGVAFTSGNGTNKPKGFLAYTQASTDDGTRAFGSLQYIATGTAGAFKTASATVSPNDDLIDLIYKLKKGYRAGAVFMMNSATLARVRKFKDQDGNYVWQPVMQQGQPSLLNGYQVVENEDMPDIGSGTVPIAFGDFKRGYYIVDRMGTRSLRDPFTNKPYVHFYTTKRVGGMLVDSQAIKLLKLSAS